MVQTSSEQQLYGQGRLVDEKGQRKVVRLINDDWLKVTQITSLWWAEKHLRMHNTLRRMVYNSRRPRQVTSVCREQKVDAAVGSGNIFLAHFGPVNNNQSIISWGHTACWSIAADHVHPFMATIYPPSNGYFSAIIIHYVAKQKSTEIDFLNTTPRVSEHLWDVVDECAAEKSAEFALCNYVDMTRISKEFFPTSYGIHACKNWGCFGSKGRPCPVLV